MSLLDAAVDLLLGGACVGCAAAGPARCAAGCRATLPPTPRPAWPDPVPTGPGAAVGRRGVRRGGAGDGPGPQGASRARAGRARWRGLLAGAAAAAATGAPVPVLLVPVPRRPGAARARGHEPLLAVCRRAAPAAARTRERRARLLRSRRGVVDQAGLDAGARAANLAGLDVVPRRRGRRLAGRPGPRRGLRRRAHDRGHGPGGAAGARGRGGASWPAIATVAATAAPYRRPALDSARRIVRWMPFVREHRSTNVCAWSPSGSVVASSGRRARPGPGTRRQADASRRRNGPRKPPRLRGRGDHGAA